MGVGKNIKRLCGKKRMTLKGLSKKSGVPVNTLYTMTREDPQSAREDTLNKIADALEITTGQLTSDGMISLELTQEQAELLIEGLATAVRTQAGAFSFIYARAQEADVRHEDSKEFWTEADKVRQKINDLDDLADSIRRVVWYNEDREDY